MVASAVSLCSSALGETLVFSLIDLKNLFPAYTKGLAVALPLPPEFFPNIGPLSSLNILLLVVGAHLNPSETPKCECEDGVREGDDGKRGFPRAGKVVIVGNHTHFCSEKCEKYNSKDKYYMERELQAFP